jgi:hypothetical protein
MIIGKTIFIITKISYICSPLDNKTIPSWELADLKEKTEETKQ